jgi:hypothetical protein
MHRVTRWAFSAIVVATGCGGRTLVEDDGGGASTLPSDADAAVTDAASSAPGTDDAASLPFFVCPPGSPPPTDSSCDTPGQICVYSGGSFCQALECDSSGHWQDTPQGC